MHLEPNARAFKEENHEALEILGIGNRGSNRFYRL